MSLLNESKRLWLLSYIICTVIVGFIYFFSWETSSGKTIVLMLMAAQLIIVIIFLFIVSLKWTSGCRIAAFVLFLGLTLVGGIYGYLDKWYIIIFTFVSAGIYMFWILGGVVNCIIVEPYKKKLDILILKGEQAYDYYGSEIDEYNRSNQLGLFKKIRVQEEPQWGKYYVSGMEMFLGENVFRGSMNTAIFKSHICELEGIDNKLFEKNNALKSNKAIREERDILDKLVKNSKELGFNNLNKEHVRLLDAEQKKRLKSERKILKKRL